MNSIISLRISAALVASLLVAALTPISGQTEEIVIGTGSRAGVYFYVGRGICRLVNANAAEHGIRCEALATPGSISNLQNLRSGMLQLGVAQSDWQYHAVNGSSSFASTGPDPDLRALFSVHGEPFTVVARDDAGIETFDDLKGKRVNIGNPGSGQRATMEVVMAAKGWDKRVFALTNELPASQQSLALCHDRIHAMIYTVGHPNDSVEQAERLCQAKIIEVQGEAIDKLVATHPYYAYTDIPGGLYAANPEAVTTFGVKATVVVSASVDDDTVYTIVKTVFENLETFKNTHPAFRPLERKKMVSDGLSAPLHEGARRYYIEQGLL